ncbi:HNH endonuclease [Fictibacillus sp. KU28468]|uniref:HNH endonuclease n=1 Tax=Fictibacillus sp. KU28468 TaxID=2991053 RepID=UPI00223DF187|nr:HNH endonuclease [Fictibacillus sp. KU28468]UZJ78605.1 HNH endonuclease [Fictibacillus sp. KU28468]
MYNLLEEESHLGILEKFEHLKYKTFIGQNEIKGVRGSGEYLPPDEFVPSAHMLHDLIRGFYKPKGKKYILSYQATESEKNYGKQIQWKDDFQKDFLMIRMSPPSSEKDNRAKSDIKAARYNMENKIPIGILYKINKGINRCLGLGLITEETNEGIFIVVPISLEKNTETLNNIVLQIQDLSHITQTEKESIIKSRIGHSLFKDNLLRLEPKCKICGMDLKELLIASHIKPWSKSSARDRLDIHNGFLLCPNHDALFDRGYISINKEGFIMISNLLDKKAVSLFQLNQNIKLNILTEHEEYLEYHRLNVFKRNR